MLGSTCISKEIANNLEKRKIINKEDVEIYAYCFDFILENILFTGIIILIGITFHSLPISILFTLILVLRRFTGGFHASTQSLCTVLSFSTFIITLFTVKLLITSNINYTFTFILLYIIAASIILLLAPVEHKNKRFSNNMKQSLQKKSRFYLGIITLGNYIFFHFHLKLYYTTTTICVMIIAINLLVAYKTYYRKLPVYYK